MRREGTEWYLGEGRRGKEGRSGQGAAQSREDDQLSLQTCTPIFICLSDAVIWGQVYTIHS